MAFDPRQYITDQNLPYFGNPTAKPLAAAPTWLQDPAVMRDAAMKASMLQHNNGVLTPHAAVPAAAVPTAAVPQGRAAVTAGNPNIPGGGGVIPGTDTTQNQGVTTDLGNGQGMTTIAGQGSAGVTAGDPNIPGGGGYDPSLSAGAGGDPSAAQPAWLSDPATQRDAVAKALMLQNNSGVLS